MNQATNPYARIDQLERDVLAIAKRCAELAHALAQQSTMLAGLMQSLGESADTLPGEKAQTTRANRTPKAN